MAKLNVREFNTPWPALVFDTELCQYIVEPETVEDCIVIRMGEADEETGCIEVEDAALDTLIATLQKIKRDRFHESRKNNVIEFGKALRAARTAAGQTLQGLANMLFCTEQSVGNWEHGRNPPGKTQRGDLKTVYPDLPYHLIERRNDEQ